MELATSLLARQSVASPSLKGSGEWRVLAVSYDGFDCVSIGRGSLLFATCPSAVRNCLKSSSLQMNYRLLNFQKRGNVKCTAFVSSSQQGSKLSHLRRNRKLGFSEVDFKRIFLPGVFEVHAKLQSETCDVADSRNKFVKFHGSVEEVNEEDDMQNTSLLLEQFPKRWVIVILCFSAFLLCNMDRVNMSIAVLLKSSFFWGYLLTQLVRITSMQTNSIPPSDPMEPPKQLRWSRLQLGTEEPYMKICLICQQDKRTNKVGLLEPLLVLEHP